MRTHWIAVAGLAVIVALMVLPTSGLAEAHPAGVSASAVGSAVFVGPVTIYPNGTLSPSNAPISESGSVYRLTASFSGTVLDERNDSTLNGSGYTLTTTPGTAVAFSLFIVTNLSVVDLTVANESYIAFYPEESGSVVLASDTVIGTGAAVESYQVDSLTIEKGQFKNSGGIYADAGSTLSILSNDLTHTTSGVYAEYLGAVTVVGNNLSFGTNYELEIEYAGQALIQQNTFYNTPAYNGYQIYLYEVGPTSIHNNTGNAGEYWAYIDYCTDTSITDNQDPDNTYAAVYAEYSSNLTVENNYFPNAADYAFYAYYVSGFSFSDNGAPHAGYYAAYVEYSSNGIISHNNLSAFYEEGIYADQVGVLTISDNQVSGGTYSYTYGIDTEYCSGLILTGNTATQNEYNWYDYESQGITAANNSFGYPISYGYSIYLEDDGTISISNTSASGGYYGAYLDYANEVRITNSQFDMSGYAGIYDYYSTAVTLSNVSVNASGYYGLYGEYATGLTATNLWLMHDVDEGAYLYEVSSVTLTGVHALYTDYAVDSEDGAGFTLAQSNLSQSSYGLYLYYTLGTTLVGNTFWADNYSFYYGPGNSGLAYHNNFLNDKAWVLASGATASFRWDNGYPSGGNYWSNYTGVDVMSGPGQNLSGSDRIGDTPFLLDLNNTDHYPLMGPWLGSTITFTESGLPSGMAWTVSLNGVPSTTTSGALVLPQMNGASVPFSYSVASIPGYHVSPASGAGTETGTDLTIPIVFAPVEYTVTFNATGLPASATWSVTINGHATTGTGPALTVQLANGSFSYSVGPVPNYSISPSSGTFSVAGGPVTVKLTATEIVYGVTFTESGLDTGTSWSVTLNGVTQTSTTSSVVFQEPNGTYAYTIGSVGGHDVTPASGTAAVTGGAVTVGVAYTTSGSSSSSSLTSSTSLGLIAGLIVVLLLAIVGWALYLMRRGKPGSPTPMTPAQVPETPAAGGAPPPSGTSSTPPPPSSGGDRPQ